MSGRRPRIGLTMRGADATAYDEARDGLARDWGGFLADAAPGLIWLPLPNLGAGIVDFARDWQLDGFIFTGGEDFGAVPVRDEGETRLLAHAVAHAMPVLGVCRGMQLIQRHFGGALRPCARDQHVAAEHPVSLHGAAVAAAGGETASVNSFHGAAIAADELADGFAALATTADGWVEAFRHRTLPLAGVMWHPERGNPAGALDRWLLCELFGVA